MTVVPSPSVPKPPGPGLRSAVVLIVVGVAILVPSFVLAIVPVVRAVASPMRFEAPGRVRVHLASGTYLIYEDTGATSIGSAFSHDDRVTITPGDVTVTGASTGADVPVRERGTTLETLSSGGDRFVGAVRFTTPGAGDYVVEVRNTAAKPVLVARPLTDTIRSALGWLLAAFLGAVVAGAGIVLTIVGSVRRGRAKRASVYVPATPAGWHPDPSGTHQWRYWDGYRWTEHVR